MLVQITLLHIRTSHLSIALPFVFEEDSGQSETKFAPADLKMVPEVHLGQNRMRLF